MNQGEYIRGTIPPAHTVHQQYVRDVHRGVPPAALRSEHAQCQLVRRARVKWSVNPYSFSWPNKHISYYYFWDCFLWNNGSIIQLKKKEIFVFWKFSTQKERCTLRHLWKQCYNFYLEALKKPICVCMYWTMLELKREVIFSTSVLLHQSLIDFMHTERFFWPLEEKKRNWIEKRCTFLYQRLSTVAK